MRPARLAFTLTAVMVALAPLTPGALAQGTPPNILIFVADDLGIEHLAVYGIGSQYIPTPRVDALAASGLLFTHAWANPVCSPTRANLQVGRYSFRTGVGDGIAGDQDLGLQLNEVTLPEVLRYAAPIPYATAAFGKWHLGVDASLGGISAPNLAGYEHFVGTAGNLIGESYYHYTRITDGTSEVVDGYLTSDTVNEAISWIQSRTGPWLAYVAFHAPHSPMHWPPDGLHSEDTGQSGDLPRYRAMMEALDTEMGRMLDTIDTRNTLIVFLSDNGSAEQVTLPPVPLGRSKHTIFEGGIRVPFILAGDLVTAGTVTRPINVSDILATVAELAGADLPLNQLDSVSLVPYFTDPGHASLRPYAYSEVFSPNGPGPYDYWNKAATDGHYKLIVNAAGTEGLMDILVDPWESKNLLGGTLNAEQRTAYNGLRTYLDNLLNLCSKGKPGDPCKKNSDCCSNNCRGFFSKTCR